MHFAVVGHWHGCCAGGIRPLHDNVAAPPAHLDESMAGEDGADGSAGEYAESTQRLPQRW